MGDVRRDLYLPDTYKIFRPIVEAGGGRIMTWGLSSVQNMWPLIEAINQQEMVGLELVVGYSRDTHNLGELVNNSRGWIERCDCPVKVFWSRNVHAKVWDLHDGTTWVGSANLVRNTLSNVMVRVRRNRTIEELRRTVLTEGVELRPGTDLALLTTRRQYDNINGTHISLE